MDGDNAHHAFGLRAIPTGSRAATSVLVAFVAACLSVSVACVPDTCAMGHTFGAIEVVETPEKGLEMSWSPGDGIGAELPDVYFEAVVIDDDGDPSVARMASITYVAPRSYLFAVTGPQEGQTRVVLRFPDRTGYVDCRHPGMNDAYFLYLDLGFRNGDLTTVTTTEDRSLGAL